MKDLFQVAGTCTRRGSRLYEHDLATETAPAVERMLAADVKAVTDGLTMIIKQFETTLGRLGISKVGTIGKSFDHGVHEAIQQVETSEHPAGTVVAEVQPGYMAGDKLIRAAMVVVAKPKPAESAGTN